MNQYLRITVYKKWLVGFVVLLTVNALYGQKKARVLFIGDNYTYTNNLPEIVANMAASTGDLLEYDISAQRDASFGDHSGHWSNTLPTLQKIRAGGWDYVVLQEWSIASVAPVEPGNAIYYAASFAYAKHLVDSVRRYNSCAKIIFFMTWGRKNGATDACRNYPPWPHYCTYHAMDSLIRMRSIELAEFNKTALSPVGAVWRQIKNTYPDIALYAPNDSDPSPAGSYVAACSFYTAIFQKPAATSNYHYSLPAEVAARIRTAADKIVYDSLSFWRIGKNETKAGFTHTTHSLQMVSFTNQSVKARQYKWNFGDGETSTAVNPIHAYTLSGTFLVELIASGPSCSDTANLMIEVADAGDAALFVVRPNPVADKLYITSRLFELDNYRMQLLNNFGQLVHDQRASKAQHQYIHVSGLPTGMYTLRIYSPSETYHKKILIQ
jgi:hypothetical protein